MVVNWGIGVLFGELFLVVMNIKIIVVKTIKTAKNAVRPIFEMPLLGLLIGSYYNSSSTIKQVMVSYLL